MNVTLHLHDEFKRQFRQLRKKYRSLTDDLEEFQKELKENPFQGDDLGGGVRKIRMAIGSKGKGKSGGARVITYNLQQKRKDVILITLMTIYDKSEIDNVSDVFLRSLIIEIETR
jgi:mRNA-degrading endonuclease RelE of RelBE toxin-antitoxin system